VLEPWDSNQAFAIRKQLDQPPTWGLLFGEWLEIIERSKNKPETYDAYLHSVAAPLKGYWQTYGTQLAQSLLDCLPANQRQEQALRWVQNQHIKCFALPLAQLCIQQANQAIPIDHENVMALKAARQLRRTAGDYQVNLHPDRPYLLEIVRAAQRNSTFDELVGVELQPALDGIDAVTYAEFLKGFLAVAFAKVREVVEHKALIRALYQFDHWDEFKAAYLDALSNSRKERFAMAERVALMYWLSAAWRDQKLAGLGDMEAEAFDTLIKRIAALSETEINRLNDEVWANKKALGQSGRNRWQWINDEVANRKRSFVSKLFGRRKS
jgi:hypothetical protein